MESGFLVLGLLGIAAIVGGLVSFFSMFSKGDQKTKLWQIEQELKQLKKQIETLEANLRSTPENVTDKQTSTALVTETQPTQTLAVTPTLALGTQENVLLSEDILQENAENNASVAKTSEIGTTQTSPAHASLTPAKPNFIERGINYAKKLVIWWQYACALWHYHIIYWCEFFN